MKRRDFSEFLFNTIEEINNLLTIRLNEEILNVDGDETSSNIDGICFFKSY